MKNKCNVFFCFFCTLPLVTLCSEEKKIETFSWKKSTISLGARKIINALGAICEELKPTNTSSLSGFLVKTIPTKGVHLVPLWQPQGSNKLCDMLNFFNLLEQVTAVIHNLYKSPLIAQDLSGILVSNDSQFKELLANKNNQLSCFNLTLPDSLKRKVEKHFLLLEKILNFYKENYPDSYHKLDGISAAIPSGTAFTTSMLKQTFNNEPSPNHALFLELLRLFEQASMELFYKNTFLTKIK